MSQSPLLPLALACVASFATLGCMMMMPPPPPPDAGRSPGAGSPQAAAEEQPALGSSTESFRKSPSNAMKEAAPPAKMIPTTVEVRSECSKTTPVFYGDGNPKFSSGRKSSISSNSISSEGRKADGTLTIWALDDHENGLGSVKVTPDTKRVTLNRDCASFKAE